MGRNIFLLTGGFGLIVAFGLFRLSNLARRAAIAIAVAGMVMLLPKVSAAATDISGDFPARVTYAGGCARNSQTP